MGRLSRTWDENWYKFYTSGRTGSTCSKIGLFSNDTEALFVGKNHTVEFLAGLLAFVEDYVL